MFSSVVTYETEENNLIVVCIYTAIIIISSNNNLTFDIEQVPCDEGEFIRIVWGSFKAAGVAWARDFCMLQKACMMAGPSTGERLFCLVSKSVERPEVPDMQKLSKRIRATADVSGRLRSEADFLLLLPVV